MFGILVVEDDEKIAGIICENAVKWGYKAVKASDFGNILGEFTKNSPDLVLMDVNLPCYDGYYWCGKIRQVSTVPVMFISARNSGMDIIMAVNTGADDFITKPFTLDVLMAKINALLRRTYSYAETETNLVEHKEVILNLKNDTITYRDRKLELTRNEFRIMYVLLKEHGGVVGRDRIMQALWDNESFVDDNTLTVNINRLRKKLGDAGLADFIQTRKNRGYIIP